MQLDGQESLLRHRVEIAVQAVDHDDRGALALDRPADRMREFAGRQLGRIDRLHRHQARVDVPPQVDPQACARASAGCATLSSKMNIAPIWPRSAAAADELRGQRRLAGARGADEERARALLDAAAQQPVQLGDAAGQLLRRSLLPMLGRDEPRKDLDAAAADDVVVVAAAELHCRGTCTTSSRRRSAPYSGCDWSSRITPCAMLCTWRSRSVDVRSSSIITVQRAGEVLLQREHLPAVAQRGAGQQAHLRERVEDDARGLEPLDCSRISLGRFGSSTSDGWNTVYCSSGSRRLVAREQFVDVDPDRATSRARRPPSAALAPSPRG